MTAPRATIPKLEDLNLVIETSRLKLRPLEMRDAEVIFETAKDPSFPLMMSWEAHASIDVTREWLAGVIANIAKSKDIVWAIEKDGVFVGQMGLLGITWQSMAWRRDRAEIGYWTVPAHQKQGVATEALGAAMRFGFESLGLHKLQVGCLAENEASKKVIERAGFRFLCKIDDDVWRADRWWSHLRYELTIMEWSDVTTTLRFSRPRPA